MGDRIVGVTAKWLSPAARRMGKGGSEEGEGLGERRRPRVVLCLRLGAGWVGLPSNLDEREGAEVDSCVKDRGRVLVHLHQLLKAVHSSDIVPS